MSNETVYFKPNVVIEPIYMGWYGWSHLISPATAALNVKNRHLKIINSYLQAPHIHQMAAKNPKMRGGPFMDYELNRSEEIQQLKEETLNHQKDLIELADSIHEVEKLLQLEAKGYSLNSLYEKIPDNVKGYIELVYDLNNNPSIKIFEALLYKSKYFQKSAQSVAFWITNEDERPFVLSTPKLKESNVVHLPIPYDDPLIDLLGKMKRNEGPYSEVEKLLPNDFKNNELFKTFFTSEKPKGYERYTGDKIRMRYYGHACILVETKDFCILVDPLISYYGFHSDLEHFSDMDLPDYIDYVLVTHNHQDHILFETLLPLRHKIGKLIVPRGGNGLLQDPNLKLMFNAIGFKNVIEIDDMEEIKFEDCIITGIPFIGEHADLNIQTKACYHIRIGGVTMMFLADSCIVEPELYKHVHGVLGNIDVIFLGMECDGAPLTWLYGPLLNKELPRDMDNSRRLAGSNYERGMSLVEIFNPTETYVYAMGQEPWVEFISSIKYTNESNPIVASNKLIEKCKDRGILAERLFGEKELLYDKRLQLS